MWAGLIADLLLIVHFAWIAFAVLGAVLILVWPLLLRIHPLVVVWSGLVMVTGWPCPLTPAENYFRRLAGESGIEGGFIEHYVAGIVYPQALTRPMQIGLGVAVLAWNALVYFVVLKYLRRRTKREHVE